MLQNRTTKKKKNKHTQSSLSAAPDDDAGCGHASPQSNENRCAPDPYFALGGKRNTVASTDA